MKVVQAGTNRLTLTNFHEPIPLWFSLVLNRKPSTFEFRVHLNDKIDRPISLEETRETLAFMQSVSTGGRVTIMPLDQPGAALIAEGLKQSNVNLDPNIIAAVNTLCEFQRLANVEIPIPFEISPEEMGLVEDIVCILKTGKNTATFTEYCFPWTIRFGAIGHLDNWLESHRQGNKVVFYWLQADVICELLKCSIPLGDMTRAITGRLTENCVTKLEEAVAALKLQNQEHACCKVDFEFTEVEVTEEFPKFASP